MTLGFGYADIEYYEYQPVSGINRTFPDHPSRDEAVSQPKLGANEFELDVTDFSKIERFNNSFRGSFHHPDHYSTDSYSAESSKKLLPISKTIVNEQQDQTFFQRKFSGWRGGIACNAIIACSILLINSVFFIWATAKSDSSNGLTTVFSGGCNKVKRLSTAAHVLVNILSTLLLAASNYAMHIASSPSRADIDKAHKKQKWLDIGVPSFRNLRWISKYRLVAFGLLLLSSIPFHLMYNSVISSSLAELYNGPVVLYVTPEYFTNPASAHTPPPFVEGIARYDISGTYQWNGSVFPALADRVRTNATLGQLTQKGVTECNKTLAGSFESSYESIVFVQTSVTSENSSLIEVGYYGIHGDRVRYGSSTDGPTGITQPINYYNLTDCWVGATEEVDCHLLLSLDLMLGVVIANTICCCVMMIMALRFTKPSLVTLGDAIASFLDTEDYTTASLRTIINRRKSQTEWLMQRTVVYKHKERRWGSSPSRLRWRFSILICISIIAITCCLLGVGLYHEISDMEIETYRWSIWSLGFGKPDTGSGAINTGVSGGSHPAALLLLANAPQIALSTGYFFVNNLLTTMIGAREWNKIGHIKTRLRTTAPRGLQKSTYFLQLPYRYSLPLMILMGTLHYLVSMSLFGVDISYYYFHTNGSLSLQPLNMVPPNEWSLNYSPLAIIFTLIASLLLLSAPIALSFRKLYPGIPIVGSNSALISAACHPPSEEGDAGLLPVQWGVIAGSMDPKTGIERCSISSGEVSKPVEGNLYF